MRVFLISSQLSACTFLRYPEAAVDDPLVAVPRGSLIVLAHCAVPEEQPRRRPPTRIRRVTGFVLGGLRQSQDTFSPRRARL